MTSKQYDTTIAPQRFEDGFGKSFVGENAFIHAVNGPDTLFGIRSQQPRLKLAREGR
jgi:hypothetical protein